MTMDNILKALRWRYAVKSFDATKTLSEADLRSLVDAVVLAPSSYGLQPWKCLVIRDAALRARLRIASYGQAQVTDCSHLVVFCRKTTIDAAYVQTFIDRVGSVRGMDPAMLTPYRDAIVGDLVT